MRSVYLLRSGYALEPPGPLLGHLGPLYIAAHIFSAFDGALASTGPKLLRFLRPDVQAGPSSRPFSPHKRTYHLPPELHQSLDYGFRSSN